MFIGHVAEVLDMYGGGGGGWIQPASALSETNHNCSTYKAIQSTNLHNRIDLHCIDLHCESLLEIVLCNISFAPAKKHWSMMRFKIYWISFLNYGWEALSGFFRNDELLACLIATVSIILSHFFTIKLGCRGYFHILSEIALLTGMYKKSEAKSVITVYVITSLYFNT